MSFTVQVYFTGLGVAVIHEDSANHGYVTGVDLLLVDSSRNMNMAMSNPVHVPHLSFEVEDLASTGAPTVNIPGVTTTGMPLVRLDLAGQDIQINVTDDAANGNGGGNGGANGNGNGAFVIESAPAAASSPGPGAPKGAVNWIPDLQADLGIADLILPGPTLAGSPYTARVKLPAGKVSSERLFLDQTGKFAQFEYGQQANHRVLADQFVWTRSGVGSLAIAGLAQPYQLDALLRRLRHEPQVVRIAVSCVPETLSNPSRFRTPDHFPMFQLVSAAMTMPNPVFSEGGNPVCAGVACPPPHARR